MGISPDMALCAYRIGDSATNAITPFMFYMPLVLTYMQQYDKQSTYGSLLKYTWRYSLVILIAWTALFVLWYLCKLPLGLLSREAIIISVIRFKQDYFLLLRL